jgi:hemoglobin
VNAEQEGHKLSPLDHFDRLGGEKSLTLIINDFVDRVVQDIMIGYLFKRVPLDRLKQREFEFARAHLGGPNAYSGRPIAEAHAPHHIMGGQFNRRLRLLEQTLLDHQVPRDIIAGWLGHNEGLRSQVTADGPFACNSALPSTESEETASS